MATCPLCSDVLLRHIRSGKTFWLCRRCRLELLEKNYLPHHPVKRLLRDPDHLAMPSVDRAIDRTSERLSPVATGVQATLSTQ